jgi:hypothetical protein
MEEAVGAQLLLKVARTDCWKQRGLQVWTDCRLLEAAEVLFVGPSAARGVVTRAVIRWLMSKWLLQGRPAMSAVRMRKWTFILSFSAVCYNTCSGVFSHFCL